MIVRCMPLETNMKLRATSRLFKQYVDEYVWEPMSYSLVRNVLFQLHMHENLPGTIIQIIVYVPMMYQALFEMRLISQQLKCVRYSEHSVVKYEFDLESMDLHYIMLEHLSNCMGEQIDNFVIKSEITRTPPPFPIGALEKIIDGVRIRSLQIFHAEIDDDVIAM
ncbi:hypothetical protein PMAYCL1PPCAC_26171 [Pristionchus mayeri]|uniref:F-box domain-containing protein n=1 Tax=Pristionchus mayeri TaxID=1317129 RepID=A0AAN5D409_9BILA|nr:hypothetical protein PMAYCL1PPCAC_26171 [Pristionchus mayeri]